MLSLTKVEQYTRQHLRYNIKVGLADGGFFGLALGFASFGTILPLFVASMTDRYAVELYERLFIPQFLAP